MISGEPSAVRDLLKSINQPQSLQSNLANLQSKTIGGAVGLLSLLATHADHGVSSSSVDQRRRVYGTNYTPSAPRKSLFQLFVDTFDDATVQILMAAAVVSLAIGIYGEIGLFAFALFVVFGFGPIHVCTWATNRRMILLLCNQKDIAEQWLNHLFMAG